MSYYVCDYETGKALRGPSSSKEAVSFINSQPVPDKYCNMSRYMLAKIGIYPRTQKGNKQLLDDVANSPYREKI